MSYQEKHRKKLREIEAVNAYNSRRNEIGFTKGDHLTPLCHKSVIQYQKQGTISHEIFNKSEWEKKKLKQLKSQVDNKKFVKLVQKGVIK